jgi:arginine exporter protein ArgO
MSTAPGWLVFGLIALLVGMLTWTRLRPTPTEKEDSAKPPKWTLVDSVIALMFVTWFGAAYTLEYVYRLSGHSHQRALAACVFSYAAAGISWASAVAPSRGRLLYQLHERGEGRRMAAAFVAAGTVALIFAALHG